MVSTLSNLFNVLLQRIKCDTLMTIEVVSAFEYGLLPTSASDDIIVNATGEAEDDVLVNHFHATITSYKMEIGPDKRKIMTKHRMASKERYR